VVLRAPAWLVPLVSVGLCLIWSFEHRQWWRPNSVGYTFELAEAGRYPLLEALRICADTTRSADPGKWDALVPLWEGIE
jgi:hypothetical protein